MRGYAVVDGQIAPLPDIDTGIWGTKPQFVWIDEFYECALLLQPDLINQAARVDVEAALDWRRSDRLNHRRF